MKKNNKKKKEIHQIYFINIGLILLFFLVKLVDILISTDSINEETGIESNTLFVLYPNLQYVFLFVIPTFFLFANFFVMKKTPELKFFITFGILFLNLIGLFVLLNNLEIHSRISWI